MRIITAIVLLFSVSAFGQINKIQQWEPTLPLSEADTIQLIQLKAFEKFYEEGTEQACGGEIAEPALVDYYTYLSADTSTVHKVDVEVYVTGSFNRCQKQIISKCKVPMTMKSKKLFGMNDWVCEVVDIEE